MGFETRPRHGVHLLLRMWRPILISYTLKFSSNYWFGSPARSRFTADNSLVNGQLRHLSAASLALCVGDIREAVALVGQWSSFRSQVLEQAARFPVAEGPVRCIAQLVLRLIVEREAVFFDVALCSAALFLSLRVSLYLDIAADMRFFISEAPIMSLPSGEDRVLRQRQLR